MTSSACTVVAHDRDTVAARIGAVPSWAPALADVAWARPVGFERYRFGLSHGKDVEEVLVAVRWDARNQRLAWRGFDGPAWSGQLRLHHLDDRRTRVQLDVLALPRTGIEAVTSMIGVGSRDLQAELVALVDAALTATPQVAAAAVAHTAAVVGVVGVVPAVPHPRRAVPELAFQS